MDNNIVLGRLCTCGLQDPLGVDVRPVFSWTPAVKSEAPAQGRGQSAYQIMLTAQDAPVWDSGKVPSAELQAVYAGPALKSSTAYRWQVRIWDEKDVVSPWSDAACFTTGITDPADWQAKWISAGQPVQDRTAPVFRKTFWVGQGLQTAVLHICGLGLYTLHINGRAADDTLLNPANTQFDVRALYRTYCAVQQLVCGQNTLTVELGNGFYNENGGVWNWQTAAWRASPRLLLQLELCYADGSKEYVLSDQSWQCTLDGPVRANGIYEGETHDARRIMAHAAWQPACPADAPGAVLSAQLMQPIRRLESFAPAGLGRLGDGAWLVTAPQMLTGWAKLRLCIPAGGCVTVRYGETLDETGHVVCIGKGQGSCGQWWPDYMLQTDTFIGNGETVEFEPRYSYKGFRYIEISGYPQVLTPADITLYRVGNDIVQSGQLACSLPRVLQLHSMMCRTLRNNFQGKPTDTPVWEKNGWLGDANVALGSMLFNFDMQAFLGEFIRTMADCLHLYGVIPVMVPTAAWFVENAPLWNSVFVFAVAELYHRQGDRALLQRLYPDLVRYTDSNIHTARANGWLWGRHDLDDWVSPIGKADAPSTPNSAEGSAIAVPAFVYRALQTMADMAQTLEKPADAARFTDAAGHIRAAFHAKFYRPAEHCYDTGAWNDQGGLCRYRTRYRQTSNILPLAFDMVPADCRQAVFDRLCRDIEEKDGHLDTGCIGTPFILPLLADMGRQDLAHRLLLQDTYPSWGYWISQGADTMWEAWDDDVRSRDHYFLGTCEEFFYTHIVGVRNIRDGWRSVVIQPAMTACIDSAGADLDTPRGRLSCHWQRRQNGLQLKLTVPFGTVARVRLPGAAEEKTLHTGHHILWEETKP